MNKGAKVIKNNKHTLDFIIDYKSHISILHIYFSTAP